MESGINATWLGFTNKNTFEICRLTTVLAVYDKQGTLNDYALLNATGIQESFTVSGKSGKKYYMEEQMNQC